MALPVELKPTPLSNWQVQTTKGEVIATSSSVDVLIDLVNADKRFEWAQHT